jgi:FMN phosphatase YigB (HAD superfamily)
MNGIKALAFDTGGTILDWHGGIVAALAACGARRRVETSGRMLMSRQTGRLCYRASFAFRAVRRWDR